MSSAHAWVLEVLRSALSREDVGSARPTGMPTTCPSFRELRSRYANDELRDEERCMLYAFEQMQHQQPQLVGPIVFATRGQHGPHAETAMAWLAERVDLLMESDKSSEEDHNGDAGDHDEQ